MMTMLQDVRFAVRLLLKQPVFSSVAILTMALAMGVSTALFSVLDSTLLRPLPYPKPSELVTVDVRESYPTRPQPMQLAPSLQDIRRWRELGSVFSHIGSGRVSGFVPLIVETGIPERLTVGSASEDFLETYGIAPILGRGIHADDTREGAPAVALLGHGFWRSRFASDPNVLGRSIRIEDEPATIVGVLPAGFYNDTFVWTAARVAPAMAERRGSGVPVVARLKPGLGLAEAAALLDANTAPAPKSTAARVLLTSMYENSTSGYLSTLQTLGAAVGVVLLIACVNVAGLLLARGFTRQPELAIRTSLGASRSRLVRQMLTESLILALAGTAVGVVIAWVALDSLVALVPFALPANSPATINLPVLAATLLLCVTTALLFGFVPAISLSRRGSIASVAAMNRTAGAPLSPRLGQLLIAGEVALALVLLSGAGLLVRSFVRLVSVDLGYDPTRTVTMEVEPLEKSPTIRNQYYADLTHALAATPQIAAAGATDHLTLSFVFAKTSAGVSVDGPMRTALPGYFESLGVRPTIGRLFVDGDRLRGDAVIVNATLAAKYFPHGALGQTLQVGAPPGRTLQVVGVVPDLRHSGPLRRATADMYALPDPAQKTTSHTLAVVFRPRDGLPVPRERLVAIAEGLGPRVLVGKIRSGGDVLDQQVLRPKNRTLLFALLGGFGLILTVVGIFGVTVYAVTRRTREIGIRLALGASRGRVVGNVVRDAAWPILIGIVVGLGAAQAATRVVRTFLFETTPQDPVTFAACVVMVVLAAGLAAWIPARRAAAIEPMTALRSE